jgi:ketosteroid isomerase-like protein
MSVTPREAFAQFQRRVLSIGRPEESSSEAWFAEGLFADDLVVELPFARPGTPRRIEGREAFAAFAEPRRAALPVRFDGFRDVAVHDTADPEVIVVEYELAGTHTGTGHSAAARFVVVLRVRDGKIARWREYQDTRAVEDALGH